MNDTIFGKHLCIKRAAGAYTHHGLGLGSGKVIHYSGLGRHAASKGEVEIVELETFTGRRQLSVIEHHNLPWSEADAIARALSRMGERQYNMLYNNCEHFVNWCLYGQHKSPQAQSAKYLYAAGIGLRVFAGTKHPAGLAAGAMAAFTWVQIQGLLKTPNSAWLERQFKNRQQGSAYLQNS